MKVAYLINQYPKVSHTFIRREILALEAQGVEVLRIALRGWDEVPVDETDRAEQTRTLYVLRGGAWSLLTAILQTAVSRPVLFLLAIRDAWRLGRQGDRPFWMQCAYLAEACWILRALSAGPKMQLAKTTDVSHLHAHFGTNPAAIAFLLRGIGGPTYSFTVHGPEEFDRPQALKLGLKANRAKAVVAISSYGRSQLYRWLGRGDWRKVQVVRCGLEPAYFREEASIDANPGAHSRRLVCVGRFNEQKGHLLLLDAARALHEEGIDFELVLAGDGELRSVIESYLITNGLREKVRITGWISSKQVRDELVHSRALVLPSFAEGLPVVIMEAFALGVPVLSTFVAGIPELVEHDRTGWLVPAGSIDELVEGLRRLLSMPASELTEMGVRSRAKVSRYHDISKSARQLTELFEMPDEACIR